MKVSLMQFRSSSRSARTVRSRAGLLGALHSQTGVVDLASVMVGVLVMGVMAGVTLSGVLVAVPYAQDQAAQSDLQTVRTAEASASARSGKYLSMADMVGQGQFVASPTLKAAAGLIGGCYVASSKSGTGTTFYSTSQDETIVSDKAGAVNTAWCVTLP
jgi:type II secretory pathway pseudopilin PulG